ncbi:hypothetical protein [Pelagibacterium lentulum]|uniref:Yip1 domain-containing protein n=1 Tax=Pelagibacterium lentulum TaxID=2029865 RepID=A0A916R842_9HYPH|nr:hypothetical protein [Pelagibacterium lentulum]GGA40042.1 hypothetical protein GCM10011499_06900 [Pelagibacterium lentulum]
MNLIDGIKHAANGWSGIMVKTNDWPKHFDLTPEGINRAIWVYFSAALLAIIVVSVRFGLPAPAIMMVEVIGHSLPVVATVIVTIIVRAISAAPAPFAAFFVPALYLLALVKIVEAITIFIGFPLLGALLGLTAFLFYKLARGNGLNMAHSVGYAIIGFLLLAGLPLALYMLVNSFTVPA